MGKASKSYKIDLVISVRWIGSGTGEVSQVPPSTTELMVFLANAVVFDGMGGRLEDVSIRHIGIEEITFVPPPPIRKR